MNEKIQRAQHKKLPENKFIELYLNCVNNVEYKNIYNNIKTLRI